MIDLLISPTFSSWQSSARELLRNNTPPSEIIWRERTAAQASLFTPVQPGLEVGSPSPPTADCHSEAHRDEEPPWPTRAPIAQSHDHPTFRVPKHFLDIARRVARHRDTRKWALLYSVLWRIIHQNRNLLAIRVDDEVSRLLRLHWEVGADAHRMKALLRFRRAREDIGDIYIGWYVPDHNVVPLVAPHFVDKFAAMRWAILTPDCCAHWDGASVQFSPGADRSRAGRPADEQPGGDAEHEHREQESACPGRVE